jgi:RecA/RadA recombinase
VNDPREADNPTLAMARWLTRQGISVVPLKEFHGAEECNDESDRLPHVCPGGAANPRGSKQPAIKTWKAYQSRIASDDELRDWFERHPQRGLAIVCGPVSAPPGKMLVGLDFDGPQSFNRLLGGLDGVPGRATLVSRTGRDGGGNHVYAYFDDNGRRKTHVHVAGERVDLQTIDALCAVPPTIHPRTGKPYTFLNRPEKIWAAPGTIDAFMAAHQAPLAGRKCLVCHPDRMPGEFDTDDDGQILITESGVLISDIQTGTFRQGGRHEVATQYAGWLLRQMPRGAALNALRNWSEARCKPPIPDDELVEMVRDFARKDREGELIRGYAAPLREIIGAGEERLLGELLHPERNRGLLTRHTYLNKAIGGLRPERLYILAGRPGSNKTGMALDWVWDIGKAGKGVLFFSLEMSALDLVRRMAGWEADINFHAVLTGQAPMLPGDEQAMHEAFLRLARYPIYIDDSSILGPQEIVKRSERLIKSAQIKLVVIDYVQLLSRDPGDAPFSKADQIADAIQLLASIAKKHGVSVLVLSQLNREAVKGAPQLHHLAESGRLEHRGDVILMLQPEEVDERAQAHSPVPPKTFLWVRKQKDGPKDVRLDFTVEGAGRRFKNLEPWP